MRIPVLSSSAFSQCPQVVFGFSTRRGGISPQPFDCNMGFGVGDLRANVRENQRRFLETLGVREETLAIPKQVHGNTVVRVDRPGVYGECDALMTKERGVFLRVIVADCLPVFLFDPATGSVGVVHSGWRGCVSGIVRRATEQMIEEFSTQPGTTRVFIGPSARSCCYEVGEDVASLFDPRFLVFEKGRRSRLDMQAHAAAQLMDLGVSSVEVSHYCTICTPDLFHSYRRDGAKSGRMMGVIGLRLD